MIDRTQKGKSRYLLASANWMTLGSGLVLPFADRVKRERAKGKILEAKAAGS